MEDDQQLLRRFVNEHSQDAFAELVRRYVHLVYSSALRTLNGDAHRAEDVAQEVFVKLARHAAALRNTTVLSGWLYTTAHHTAVKAVRSDSRRRRREQEAHAMANTNQPDNESGGWDSIGPLLDDAMHQLARADRDAVLLRFFEGRPFGDIGAKLGLSENAARMRVDRGLDKLCGLLAQRGIGSTSAALSALLTQQAVTAAPASLAAAITATSMAIGPAAGVTLAGLGFMSTGKLAALLGVIAAGAIGFSIREATLRTEAERTVASLRSEGLARGAQVVARPAETDGTARAGANVSAGAFDVRRYEQEKARQLAERAKANALAQVQVAGSPEMLQLRLKPFRATAHLHFAALYRMLDLPSDKVDAFAKLVEEKFWAVADLTSSAMAQGVSRFDPAFQQMREQSLAPIEGKIRALLGETGYRTYADHEAIDSGRRLVEQLSGRLALAASPLTLDQASELARIFTRNALKEAPPLGSWIDARSMGYTPEGLTLADIQWDNSLPQMQKVLSADQVFALNALYMENTLTAVADRSFEKRVRETTAR